MKMYTVNKARQQTNEKIKSGEFVAVNVEDIIGIIKVKGFISNKVC